MFALLLSVLGVYCTERLPYGFLPGAVLICLSMGLYQSFFAAAAALFVMLSIRHILSGNSSKTVLRKGMSAILSLLLGGVVYFIAVKWIIAISDVVLTDGYNGIAKVMDGAFNLTTLPLLFVKTYQYLFRFLFQANGYTGWLLACFNLLLSAGLIIAIVLLARARRVSHLNLALLILLSALLPFALNLTYFISQGIVHMLMLYSWFLLYPFALSMFEAVQAEFPQRAKYGNVQLAICVLLGCLLWNNIIYANGAYLKKDLEGRATLSVITRIVDRLEQTEGYIPNETLVYIVGDLNASLLSQPRAGFERYSDEYAIGMSYNYGLSYGMSINYFSQQMAYPIRLASNSSVQEIALQPQVREIPAFPAAGSVAFVGDTLIVKLS